MKKAAVLKFNELNRRMLPKRCINRKKRKKKFRKCKKIFVTITGDKKVMFRQQKKSSQFIENNKLLCSVTLKLNGCSMWIAVIWFKT